MADTSSMLYEELKLLEGIIGQDPETGSLSGESYIKDYTNRVFGAPFQLLDSVDKRFSSVNPYLGNEYLRNFTLNSPILHIRPGMPKYTGGTSSTDLLRILQNLYVDGNSGNLSNVQSLLTGLASSTIFKKGSKLQRRMFGFRETYYDYMQNVNYMCRSMATFLNLTTGDRFPSGTFISVDSGSSQQEKFEEFSTIKWENYRMMRHSTVLTPKQYLEKLIGSTGMGVVGSVIGSGVEGFLSFLNPFNDKDISEIFTAGYDKVTEAFDVANNSSIIGNISDKISAVEFVVEPVSFEETLENTVKSSAIEAAINTLREGVGSEIGFITNSNAAPELLENITNFLGDTTESVATSIGELTKNVTGGFMTNLFSGAIQSIKGQKMIYPKIYDTSTSSMNYQFTVNLTSPYGDVYNYYMNIVVPLMHLIALASPRMVTANTVASPYLVQAYIPGMCTCHLGIISNMTIQKNPKGNHVSVNGFPLDVKVTFTIQELYNSMAISPGNDPSSFLFNETLNDYLANLAGLIPSVDTYTKQRKAMFQALENYITSGEWMNDALSGVVDKIEDIANPFLGR